MSNKWNWLLITVFSITVGFIILTLIYSYLVVPIGSSLVGERDPTYLEERTSRTHFTTVQCESLSQWDTIQYRIAAFYKTNPQYIPPDSLGIDTIWCKGCAIIRQPVYLSGPLREVYIVNFDMSSFDNYIEYVYKEQNGKLTRMEANLLDSVEKQRIVTRLETQMLNKIKWKLDGIE